MRDLRKKDFNGNVVIGTGNLCRVGDLVEFAFAAEGLDAKRLIKQDKRFMRLESPPFRLPTNLNMTLFDRNGTLSADKTSSIRSISY